MRYCILVSGIPASGKTTMARELSRRLALPLFSKDDIKEILFDTVGFSSRAEKVRLGEAAQTILYATRPVQPPLPPPEAWRQGVQTRGMDSFCVPGPRLVVDASDVQAVDAAAVAAWVAAQCKAEGL